MSVFETDICSPPDREKLVARIMYDNEQVAEINQETSTVRVELYARQSGEPWIFPYDEFLDALKRAKTSLVGPD